ncbi:BgTH12-07452 [Blumeria graminis f. sp. triticale]|uniref:Solute carrier family 66 member 3 n=3 Tax=Blumeria graminis TaxID=34373 RepID=A0A381LB90_BLUGR|nr:mannose-P-dolichol utilization defect [Blumeria graminis f. sp. tritici 96224]CAD6500272.1 BgTH12-07452 [Blumeria graminis f. sp. triticale]VCU40520.1 Bgt-39 [Blumeria graminis f. sp. tritici]
MDAVRSLLLLITRKIPLPIQNIAISTIGDECYQRLVLDINLESTECLKLVISKALGIGIIGASSIVKVPQILKLVKSRSAAGISFLSYLLETSSYLISLAYNIRNGFPFSTYGETSLILLQNIVISALVLHYSGNSSAAATFISALAFSTAMLLEPSFFDLKLLSYLQVIAGLLGVFGKFPQIWTIWKQGGTGQLSAFAARSLARVFTTLQEVDDKLILYSFLAGASLNAVLAAQMLYYWNVLNREPRKIKDKPTTNLAAKQPKATQKSQGPSTRRRG